MDVADSRGERTVSGTFANYIPYLHKNRRAPLPVQQLQLTSFAEKLMDYYQQSFHARNCLVRERHELLEERTRAHESVDFQVGEGSNSQISSEEMALYVRYYQSKLLDTCKYFRFPLAVVLTGSWLLARYHRRCSPLTVDTKHVMLACILLASKCHSLHLTQEQFLGRIPNTDASLVADLEVSTVLPVLEYQIHFYSPLEPLGGLLIDMEVVRRGEEDPDRGMMADGGKTSDAASIASTSPQKSKDIPADAMAMLARLCATDALFLYTPAQLALLALLLVDEAGTRKYITCREELLSETHSIGAMIKNMDEALGEVRSMLAELDTLQAAQIKDIDRRVLQLRRCILLKGQSSEGKG